MADIQPTIKTHPRGKGCGCWIVFFSLLIIFCSIIGYFTGNGGEGSLLEQIGMGFYKLFVVGTAQVLFGVVAMIVLIAIVFGIVHFNADKARIRKGNQDKDPRVP